MSATSIPEIRQDRIVVLLILECNLPMLQIFRELVIISETERKHLSLVNLCFAEKLEIRLVKKHNIE